jgi:regulator of sigma E protease
VAGPLANLLLPVVIFWAVFTFIGQPYFVPVIGSPEQGSPAVRAGLEGGDRIQAVNGTPIQRWDELESALSHSEGRPLELQLDRRGQTTAVSVEPRAAKVRDLFGQEMEVWDLGLHPLIPTQIGQVLPGQAAQQAGIMGGDTVVAINGQPVTEWDQMAKMIHASAGTPLQLTVEREGQRLTLPVTPRASKQQGPAGEEEVGLIGIAPGAESHYMRLNPVSAFVPA